MSTHVHTYPKVLFGGVGVRGRSGVGVSRMERGVDKSESTCISNLGVREKSTTDRLPGLIFARNAALGILAYDVVQFEV